MGRDPTILPCGGVTGYHLVNFSILCQVGVPAAALSPPKHDKLKLRLSFRRNQKLNLSSPILSELRGTSPRGGWSWADFCTRSRGPGSEGFQKLRAPPEWPRRSFGGGSPAAPPPPSGPELGSVPLRGPPGTPPGHRQSRKAHQILSLGSGGRKAGVHSRSAAAHASAHRRLGLGS